MHDIKLTSDELDSVMTFCEMYLDMMHDCKGQDPVVDRCISDAQSLLDRFEVILPRQAA